MSDSDTDEEDILTLREMVKRTAIQMDLREIYENEEESE